MIDHVERYKKFLFILPYGIRAGRRRGVDDHSEARVYLNSPEGWQFTSKSTSSPLWVSGTLQYGLLKRIYAIVHD